MPGFSALADLRSVNQVTPLRDSQTLLVYETRPVMLVMPRLC